jgi:hypothetical protein
MPKKTRRTRKNFLGKRTVGEKKDNKGMSGVRVFVASFWRG